MRRLLLALIIGVFLISLGSAQEDFGTFKQNECVTLVQTCANCTFVNVTSVIYPNSSIAESNKAMSADGTYYSYSYCNTSLTGKYTVTGLGDSDGIIEVWNYEFTVTPTGTDLDFGKAVFYVIIIFIGIGLFLLALVGAVSLPYDNNRDEMTGYILSVSNKKYFKVGCAFAAYLILLCLTYFAEGLVNNFLELSFVGSLLHFWFVSMLVALLPITIITIYVFIANWVRDNQLGEYISRGFHTR